VEEPYTYTTNTNIPPTTSTTSTSTPEEEQGLDLLSKLLVYDHNTRLTAKQAMQHAFFDSVRHRVERQIQETMIPTSAARGGDRKEVINK
jgi:serine/threonine protein kinase